MRAPITASRTTGYGYLNGIHMRVKFAHDQHRTVVKLVLAVHLMPDIHAHAAPPDFALLERGRMMLGVQLFLLTVPGWEVLLHRLCMTQNMVRVQ